MSGLLKSGVREAVTKVKPFHGQQVSSGAKESTVSSQIDASALTDPVQNERGSEAIASQVLVERLEAESRRLQQELEELAARSETRESDAYQKGMRDGTRQTAEETARRDDILKDALAAANNAMTERLNAIEILALQLAKSAVVRVLGDRANRDELLVQAITWQMQRLAASKPTVLRLSKADFPEGSNVAAMAARWPDLTVRVDRELAAGECRLALEMGEVEIGLPGQIERLTALFDSWSEQRESQDEQVRAENSGNSGVRS